ncbi:hypothetical protein POM88_013382 [Heracleum sosnowskyi]|uniref:SBP-type domain-containing protein n=1 Tax=Heracleum sosnowskyi TaxID=360622 RepID=A0AAD8IZ18_9APIA|nr:hypothetical protein POM88_013382 [Heracleum sosnowskyi]
MRDRMNADVVKEDEEDEDAEDDNKEKRVMTYRKGSGGGSAQPCCQVQDCLSNMSIAKAYHRMHKVCEFHAKAPVVLISGVQQRFCQQCSRLGNLIFIIGWLNQFKLHELAKVYEKYKEQGDQKVAAIGVSASKWITFHGVSVNVTTDLTPFMKHSVRVGEMGYREVAAYLLDHDHFAKVPPTALVKITHSIFNVNDSVNWNKLTHSLRNTYLLCLSDKILKQSFL